MQKAAITEESYVRHLPHHISEKIAYYLDIGHLWERLASRIPARPDSIFNASDGNFEPRYTMADIARFSACKRSTKALISDWGMQNCRIKHLVEALYQAELNAVAEYIQRDILHIERRRCHIQQSIGNSSSDNERPTQNSDNKAVITHNHILNTHNESVGESPQSYICERQLHNCRPCDMTSSESTMNNDIIYNSERQKSNSLAAAAPGTDSSIIVIEQLCEEDFEGIDQPKDIPFDTLKAITNNFDQKNYKDGGNLIGEGGFGTVFIGSFSSGLKVAVKCLKDSSEDSLDQFETEVETLGKFKHENLVRLLGYSRSKDGLCCLVYQYMLNGSLEERLACRYNTEPLSNIIRLEIAIGTARGIEFLHKGGLVHRDIKSANILLDATFQPKVGDFATARILPLGLTSHIMKASVVIGTMAYLAPEALSFVIHPSLDAFSFGVVILEILTGLPVTDATREEKDLKIHVQEHCCEGEEAEEAGTIYDLLDKQGGEWSKPVVDGLYSISCRCLEDARKKRPKMADILLELEGLKQTVETSQVL